VNIRSVDLQVLVPRATEASKAQQQLDTQILLAQQQFDEEMKKSVLLQQKRVQASPKNAGGRVESRRYDREQSKNQTAKGDKGEPEAEQHNNNEASDASGNVLAAKHQGWGSIGNIVDIKT